MSRSLRGETLLVATHNAGKLAEFQSLLQPFGVTTLSAGAMGLPVPDETGTSFRANAHLKAAAASAATGLVVVADDSGLCVDALDGDPGVYTADWAGPERDWLMAMERVEAALVAKGAITQDQRGAAFHATLCVMWPDGEERFYEGVVRGHLVWPPRGPHGHGYDPVFVPQGETRTFAELSEAKKNAISHRARALDLMRQDLA